MFLYANYLWRKRCRRLFTLSRARIFFQELDEIGDVNVTMYESYSREEGRGGRRWEISFTSLGLPSHVGEIQVKRRSLFDAVAYK